MINIALRIEAILSIPYEITGWFMSTSQNDPHEISPSPNDDELEIIEFCRVLRLGKEEALKRLSIPSSSAIHRHGQELAFNLTAAADELAQSEADPFALSGHEGPT